MPRQWLLMQWPIKMATGIVKPGTRQYVTLPEQQCSRRLYTCRSTGFRSPRFFNACAGRFSRSAGASVGWKLNAGRWENRRLSIRRLKLRRKESYYKEIVLPKRGSHGQKNGCSRSTPVLHQIPRRYTINESTNILFLGSQLAVVSNIRFTLWCIRSVTALTLFSPFCKCLSIQT